MGFFSTIARVLGGIARTVLGVAPAAAAVAPAAAPAIAGVSRLIGGAARVAGAAGRFVSRQAVPIGVGLAAGAAGQALVGALQDGRGAVVMGGGLGRGNGQFAKQTIVETIRLADGAVVRQEVFAGAPFLMQKAVRELRATTKKLTRANARIPRKTREKSKNAQLLDAVLDRALSNVAACPK